MEKRLLCIVGSMNVGGAETFLMKIYRVLDKTRFQMDFAVATNTEGVYDKEIVSLGGRIYHITPKSSGIIKNYNSIKHIVKEKKYKYVLRTSQHSLSALELLAAKSGGAKIRVFRSSNSNTTTGSNKQLILHNICKFMPMLFANIRIAPSTKAAEFMFGKDCIKKGNALSLTPIPFVIIISDFPHKSKRSAENPCPQRGRNGNGARRIAVRRKAIFAADA